MPRRHWINLLVVACVATHANGTAASQEALPGQPQLQISAPTAAGLPSPDTVATTVPTNLELIFLWTGPPYYAFAICDRSGSLVAGHLDVNAATGARVIRVDAPLAAGGDYLVAYRMRPIEKTVDESGREIAVMPDDNVYGLDCAEALRTDCAEPDAVGCYDASCAESLCPSVVPLRATGGPDTTPPSPPEVQSAYARLWCSLPDEDLSLVPDCSAVVPPYHWRVIEEVAFRATDDVATYADMGLYNCMRSPTPLNPSTGQAEACWLGGFGRLGTAVFTFAGYVSSLEAAPPEVPPLEYRFAVVDLAGNLGPFSAWAPFDQVEFPALHDPAGNAAATGTPSATPEPGDDSSGCACAAAPSRRDRYSSLAIWALFAVFRRRPRLRR